MKKVKICIFIVVALLVVLPTMAYVLSPFMICSDGIILGHEVREFDCSHSIWDEPNHEWTGTKLYLVCLKPVKNVEILIESIEDKNMKLIKSDFYQKNKHIWQCDIKEPGLVDIYAVKVDDKKYYFIYKTT